MRKAQKPSAVFSSLIPAVFALASAPTLAEDRDPFSSCEGPRLSVEDLDLLATAPLDPELLGPAPAFFREHTCTHNGGCEPWRVVRGRFETIFDVTASTGGFWLTKNNGEFTLDWRSEATHVSRPDDPLVPGVFDVYARIRCPHRAVVEGRGFCEAKVMLQRVTPTGLGMLSGIEASIGTRSTRASIYKAELSLTRDCASILMHGTSNRGLDPFVDAESMTSLALPPVLFRLESLGDAFDRLTEVVYRDKGKIFEAAASTARAHAERNERLFVMAAMAPMMASVTTPYFERINARYVSTLQAAFVDAGIDGMRSITQTSGIRKVGLTLMSAALVFVRDAVTTDDERSLLSTALSAVGTAIARGASESDVDAAMASVAAASTVLDRLAASHRTSGPAMMAMTLLAYFRR